MENENDEIKYPMRLNRYLALRNYCSRREADALIEKGMVLVNGKKAIMGQKVNEDDQVKVGDMEAIKKYVYYAYNKPKGIVTHSPQKGEKAIADVATVSKDVFPIGRLDKESRGLILLSNDGRITDKLLNPEREHEKEYIVVVNKPITNIFLKVMAQGVELENYKTKPCQVKAKDEFTFHIVLTEGKKHQIRRMCAALGWAVADLKRIRIMNIKLEKLPAGKLRKIEGEELQALLKSMGI